MTKDLNEWKRWNQQGWIPGPQETEEAFIQRVTFCRTLRHSLLQHLGKELPFSKEGQGGPDFLKEAWPLTQQLYGITPDWVPLFFGNDQLAPWHAGCAWIFQLKPETPVAALLQLRKNLQDAGSYLGIYQRKELLAHELAHIGRMAYEEPQFEEMLAYQSSSSWRRWLGPIFQSNKETLFFIFVLLIPLMGCIALPLGGISCFLLFLLPLAFLLFSLGRLFYRHQTLKRCQKQLEELYSNRDSARHLLYRLRDQEIREFASLSPMEIKEWMNRHVPCSFRWQFLTSIYTVLYCGNI